MDLTLGNPAGLWALAAIPAVFAIHFFQRRTRRQVVTTLFLLEPEPHHSRRGRRFERLRSSPSLWLQLASALLLTWVLAQPRWVREDSVQRIVIALDSSVSMRVFRGAAASAVERRSRGLERAAGRTEWILLETDPRAPTLYSGYDRDELVAAAAAWMPGLGEHDPAPVLETARSLVADGGATLWITDHPGDAPAGVDLVAVGRPTDNVGFAGARVERADGPAAGRPEWKAILRNYSDRPQQRRWWIETADGPSEPATLHLDPDRMTVLSGVIPPDHESATLVLDGDTFDLDDRLPMVVPRPRRLAAAVIGVEDVDGFTDAFLGAFDAIDRVGPPGDADLVVQWVDPGVEPAPYPGFVFARTPDDPRRYRRGTVVPMARSLADVGSWQGLLVPDTPTRAPAEGDDPLVWIDDLPIVFTRPTPGGRQVVFAFPLAASNAARLPAPLLLAHRYVEEIRAAKPAPEQRNVDTGQRLELAATPDGPPMLMRIGDRVEPIGPVPRAPREPALFQVTEGDRIVLTGAARFADNREADLRNAGEWDHARPVEAGLRAAHSRPDPWAPIWLAAVAGLMLTDWGIQARRKQ